MRRLLIVAALCASCSWSEETAAILVHVDGIPVDADHLDVVLTPSDTTVTGKDCVGTANLPTNATCYRPSFQPVETGSPLRSVDLAFAAPAATGTFTVQVYAADRTCPSVCTAGGLAQGTASGTLPGPENLQVTLH